MLDNGCCDSIDDRSAERRWSREVTYLDDDAAIVTGDVDGLSRLSVESIGDFADGSSVAIDGIGDELVRDYSETQAVSVSFLESKHEGIA